MSSSLYSADVRALFERAPGAGRPTAVGWVSGEGREPLTATHVRWHLLSANGHITDAQYEVRGCPHTIAVAAVLAQRLIGQPVTGLKFDVAMIARELSCDVSKLGRLFAIEDAIWRAAHILRP
jgi:NifU-like protein involved in Fe-S cluster formation